MILGRLVLLEQQIFLREFEFGRRDAPVVRFPDGRRRGSRFGRAGV
jgi:hypothetical protein